MPQGNVGQETGHSHTATNTGLKYRSTNVGNPLSHQDVDDNFELLRTAVNGLVADLGAASSSAASNNSSIAGQLSSLQSDIADASTNITNITNGTTTISWDQITGAPDQLNNADTNGATFGDTVNSIPAIELTYPAGPKIRGGTEVPTGSPPYVGGQTEFINNDGTGWSGITALSLTLAGGYKENPTDPEPRSFITNGENGLTFHTGESGQQACIQGDLKVSGKIIAEGDLVVDGDLEDSSGNSVGGGGPWQSCNVNFLSYEHISSAGTNLTIDIHNSLPDAIEVCMEVTCNEQHLQYYNVYTKSWETILNVGNNIYGQSRVSIPLAPGNVGWFNNASNANVVTPNIIDPGTIRLLGYGADSNGGTIYTFKAIYWR